MGFACSATLATTDSRSWPASADISWMRTECLRASSLERCRRTVRRMIATTGAALSSSSTSAAAKGRSSCRWAESAPTTRPSWSSGTQPAALGLGDVEVGGGGEREADVGGHVLEQVNVPLVEGVRTVGLQGEQGGDLVAVPDRDPDDGAGGDALAPAGPGDVHHGAGR